jgi:uncharacterized membrane protein
MYYIVDGYKTFHALYSTWIEDANSENPMYNGVDGVTMPKERDEDSGKFTEVVSDEEIISFLSNQDGVVTSKVAKEFDYERPTAYRRLKNLEADGRIESRKVGNSLLWLSIDTDS